MAQWKRSTLLSKFGGTFDDLTQGCIGATNSSLTVSKVYVPRATAHTHSYNGEQTVMLPATETTKGRIATACSVSGCDAVKITVAELNLKPVVTATAGTEQITLKWNAIDGATEYRVESEYRTV